MLRVLLVGVADHAEQAVRLRHAVNSELRVENFVAAVFAVGLREHHQLNIGGIARQCGEGLVQVVDLILRQGQAKLAVGCVQSRFTCTEHINMRHRCRLYFIEQTQSRCAIKHDAFGHAVVKDGGHLRQLVSVKRHFTEQWLFDGQTIFHDAFDSAHGQATVMRNVGRLGRPGRNGAKTRTDNDERAVICKLRLVMRLSVSQQCRQLRFERSAGRRIRRHQVQVACADA